MIVTFATYAAVFYGIVCCTDLGSKPFVVTVVLTLRKLLWMVYLGVKGDTTSSSVDPGTNARVQYVKRSKLKGLCVPG